jgi:hypothetical protein
MVTGSRAWAGMSHMAVVNAVWCLYLLLIIVLLLLLLLCRW